jgi:hypothetical protein
MDIDSSYLYSIPIRSISLCLILPGIGDTIALPWGDHALEGLMGEGLSFPQLRLHIPHHNPPTLGISLGHGGGVEGRRIEDG